MPPQKLMLHLAGPRIGLPSLADLIELAKAITGRDPSPEEVEQAMQKIARYTE